MRALHSVIILVSLFATFNCISSIDTNNVIFVIVSQIEPYHARIASRLKQDIKKQVLGMSQMAPKVHLTHEDFPIRGAWTIYTLLPKLLQKYVDSDVRWMVFLESHTAVRCSVLFQVLTEANDNPETKWIGYPLSDEEPTIIHHFQFYEDLNEEEGGFIYPYFAAGFAMKMDLIKKLTAQMSSGESKLEAEFSIDPAFELAQLVYGAGHLMVPELRFCLLPGDHCATYPTNYDICGSAIAEESIFFAVKTYSGYHDSRVQVVKKTWGRLVSHILFFSDKQDPSIPSIDLGVPNVKNGHCTKTIEILKYVVNLVKDMPKIQWIFLADDDTILGVQRLCEVLSCFRGGEAITVIGERYGYGYGKKETAAKGYDFITGGGGTVLSVSAARALSACSCAAISAPDDMTLGACATYRHNMSLTHVPLFYQNRPQDYSRSQLSRSRPVSFHRHSSPAPLRVFATWFLRDHNIHRKTNDEL